MGIDSRDYWGSATVSSRVGAEWMDTLGTVQKHSMQEMA
jgi:hypothetical protein